MTKRDYEKENIITDLKDLYFKLCTIKGIRKRRMDEKKPDINIEIFMVWEIQKRM
jgi:hypothetical protein